MTGASDVSGKSPAGDFDAQVRATFAIIEQTLKEAGGKLSDLVTMTGFLTDPRNHRRMTEIRREILGKVFPASASISISHLANPNASLKIQAVAVVGELTQPRTVESVAWSGLVPRLPDRGCCPAR